MNRGFYLNVEQSFRMLRDEHVEAVKMKNEN